MGDPSSQSHVPSLAWSDPPSQMSAVTASPALLTFLLTPARKSFSAWLFGIARLDSLLRILHFLYEMSLHIHDWHLLSPPPERQPKSLSLREGRSSSRCRGGSSICWHNACWGPVPPPAPSASPGSGWCWSPPGWCLLWGHQPRLQPRPASSLSDWLAWKCPHNKSCRVKPTDDPPQGDTSQYKCQSNENSNATFQD